MAIERRTQQMLLNYQYTAPLPEDEVATPTTVAFSIAQHRAYTDVHVTCAIFTYSTLCVRSHSDCMSPYEVAGCINREASVRADFAPRLHTYGCKWRHIAKLKTLWL